MPAGTLAHPPGTPSPPRVLFLDVDGVLNSYRTTFGLGGVPRHIDANDLALFDHAAVGLVRALCKTADVSIVLSSAWRILTPWAAFGEATSLPVVDRTPSLTGCRGDEIKWWLDHHPGWETYAILDDSQDMLEEQLPQFVCIDGTEGLMWRDFEKLCALFSVSPFACRSVRARPLSKNRLVWEAGQ